MNELDNYSLDQKSWSFLDIIGQAKMEKWTPVDGSGAGLIFTGVDGIFAKIGPLIFAFGALNYPVTIDGTNARIGGFPFTSANTPSVRGGGNIAYSNNAVGLHLLMDVNANTAAVSNLAGALQTNANVSNTNFFFLVIYFV
jgi:hypothetical protein